MLGDDLFDPIAQRAVVANLREAFAFSDPRRAVAGFRHDRKDALGRRAAESAVRNEIEQLGDIGRPHGKAIDP
ncbi:MAG TPA: hypothetical protein VGL90_07985, partial [Casimicrobiaceae bacterium]